MSRLHGSCKKNQQCTIQRYQQCQILRSMRELQVVQLKGEIVQTLQNSTQSLGKHWKILKYQEYVTLIVPHWRAYDKGKIWYPNRTWTYDLPHQYWEWILTTVKTIYLQRWIGCTNYATSSTLTNNQGHSTWFTLLWYLPFSFQCCFVMVFRQNCPISRPTSKGKGKRTSRKT